MVDEKNVVLILFKCHFVLDFIAKQSHTAKLFNFFPPFKLRNILCIKFEFHFNPLASNDVYTRRTAQLTSRRYILNIYSTNILTEYFKPAAHSPFFSLQDAVYFIILSILVPVMFTF